VQEELVTHTIELPSGEMRLLQPAEAAEIPDDHQVEWAPLAPYWSVLWRSGIALARQLDGESLRGLRVVELGCGLAAPSIAAARGGADVIATDGDSDALQLVVRANIHLSDRPIDGERDAYAGSIDQVIDDVIATRDAGADEVILGLVGGYGLDELLDGYARIADGVGLDSVSRVA